MSTSLPLPPAEPAPTRTPLPYAPIGSTPNNLCNTYMDFLKQNLMPILAGVFLLGGIFVYMNFFAAPAAPRLRKLTSHDAIGACSKFAGNACKTCTLLKLDNSIFLADPSLPVAYRLWRSTIPAQNAGNRNPFCLRRLTASALPGTEGTVKHDRCQRREIKTVCYEST